MKLLCIALPLLYSLVTAQTLQDDECQCPQVKCPASDTFEGCRCTNLAELKCKRRCPKYIPTGVRICSLPKQTTTQTKSLPTLAPPSPTLYDTPLIPDCECEEMMCIQSYPASCHCANGIKIACWAKCGGLAPLISVCPPLEGDPLDSPVERAAAPELQAVKISVSIPEKTPTIVSATVSTATSAAILDLLGSSSKGCHCELPICIQSFPDSCLCSNAGKRKCWKKCGGPKPILQTCVPKVTPKPKPTPTPTPEPHNHQVCGGFRPDANSCPDGYTCINDPYKSGCGLECDGTGICVKEKLCGGFAGFQCEQEGQACVDDPRDDCSPETGGADCGGLCVWPPEQRME